MSLVSDVKDATKGRFPRTRGDEPPRGLAELENP